MRSAARLAVVLGAWLLGVVDARSDAYEATRARPLFSPTRRPLPPPTPMPLAPVEPPLAQPPAPPSLTLSGVVLGPGISIALLIRPGTVEATRAALGSQIDGWHVLEIRPRAVVLTLGDRRVTLMLPEAAH